MPTRNLRSQNNEDFEDVVKAGETDQSDRIEIIPVVGKLYSILGDSISGYYLVQCLSTDADSFSGKYHSLSYESSQDKTVIFKDTAEKDIFYNKSLGKTLKENLILATFL